MKSYLSLVPISGKVRKRQNRMTIFCIIISVLLVTAIFSVADMFIRTQSEGLQHKHGNWHIRLGCIPANKAVWSYEGGWHGWGTAYPDDCLGKGVDKSTKNYNQRFF